MPSSVFRREKRHADVFLWLTALHVTVTRLTERCERCRMLRGLERCMDLASLIADPRNSVNAETARKITRSRYERTIASLSAYRFWKGSKRHHIRPLFESQTSALALAGAYLSADVRLAAEGNAPEAALIKMPTGAGKSGVVAVLARGLPSIRKVLVLTPRAALAEQMRCDVAWRFWKRLGLAVTERTVFSAEADIAGAALAEAAVLQLLPSETPSLRVELASAARVVLIGTFQALDQLRRTALAAGPQSDAGDLRKLIGQFDAIVVDEAHYEPAPSWSRAVREFQLPTILLSATPYRNDYKSFRVRGRFVFNYSLKAALEQKVIRSVHFQSAQVAGQTDIDQFVALLQDQVPALLQTARTYTAHPKIIIHADDFEKAKLLQGRIRDSFGELPILIHHQISNAELPQRRFHSVDRVRRWKEWEKVSFWVHETKLLEGIDDPSFVAVALYDSFKNARQLIQQIGRALRSTDPDFENEQRAWVLSLPEMNAQLEASWKRYEEFEEYASEDPRRLVEAEGALPDRLLEHLPVVQYLAGEFRPRFDPNRAPVASDFRIPASASVFEVAPDFDLTAAGVEVEESLLAEDRFKPVRIRDLPVTAIGYAYYAWRSSPYLQLQFFPEWTLGLCVLVQVQSLLFVSDTGGIVFDPYELGLRRPERAMLQKLIPESTPQRKVRVNRLTAFSLDTSERSIRSMAIRTRSIEEVFDLLDSVLVPTTTAGFVNGRGRYVGFSRARLSDIHPDPVALPNYCDWVTERAEELRDAAIKSNPLFGRYAKVRDRLSEQQAVPLSILIDFDGDLLEFPALQDEDRPPRQPVDVEYDDLCADITGYRFEITLAGRAYACAISFYERTQRYKIESDALDAAFPGKSVDAARPGLPITALINREQLFRIIVQEPGVIYAGRKFYEPNLEYVRDDGSIPLLENVFSVPALARIRSEKGEAFFNDAARWVSESIFGLIHAICTNPHHGGADARSLREALQGFSVVVCDDDGQEVGDFLAIDEQRKRVALMHAKAAKGTLMSATELQAVGRQVLASLAFCSSVARPAKITPGRWGTPVNANGTLLNLNRIFRQPAGMTVSQIEALASRVLADRSWNREIWIMAGNLMSRDVVEHAIRTGDSNRTLQFLMYVEILLTGCGRLNSTLKIYCN